MKTANKIAIYTSIYGNKDDLILAPDMEGVDTILFTDREYKTNWDVRNLEPEFNCNNLNAKRFKILPHKFLPEYDLTIWIDGNVDIINLRKFIETYKNKEMTVFDHTFTRFDSRNCLYDEANAIIRVNKDNQQIVQAQIDRYKKLGFPKNNGLICGGILMRKNTEVVNNVMDSWWSEITNGSKRDQISFNFVAWVHNFVPHYIKTDIRVNEFFNVTKQH